jgi:hypothetical protein
MVNGDYNMNLVGNGYSLSSSANTIGGVFNNAINQPANIMSGLENTVEKGVTGAVSLGKETVGGAVSLGKDTVGGAVGLGKDAATGAVNEINAIGSGAWNAVSSAASGAVGLGKDITHGILNLGREAGENQRRYAQGQGQGQGQDPSQIGYQNSYGYSPNQMMPQNNGSNIDRSNLYGAMPNKGNSNYMPLGSDFSKFGR